MLFKKLTKKEQRKTKLTKYPMEALDPHSGPCLTASLSHILPEVQDNMIDCHASPVAHLSVVGNKS